MAVCCATVCKLTLWSHPWIAPACCICPEKMKFIYFWIKDSSSYFYLDFPPTPTLFFFSPTTLFNSKHTFLFPLNPRSIPFLVSNPPPLVVWDWIERPQVFRYDCCQLLCHMLDMRCFLLCHTESSPPLKRLLFSFLPVLQLSHNPTLLGNEHRTFCSSGNSSSHWPLHSLTASKHQTKTSHVLLTAYSPFSICPHCPGWDK